jgi:hypothetical protein
LHAFAQAVPFTADAFLLPVDARIIAGIACRCFHTALLVGVVAKTRRVVDAIATLIDSAITIFIKSLGITDFFLWCARDDITSNIASSRITDIVTLS